MHVKKYIKPLAFLACIAIFSGCDAMNTFLPSPNTYKLSARVNGVSLDDCSFITVNDKIQPFFEESIAGDPDVTAIMVYFRNTKGEIAGWKTVYSLNGEAEQDELLITVESLDDNLPSVPIPPNFPVGRYTMITHVMSGKEILQRTEKAFYYMGDTGFTYEGIHVHLPGVTENSQIIPRGLTVLLEAKLDFNSPMDPYIVWYNGRRKVSEGRFSEGAGYLLWKAPDQSGFYSVTAEIFPSDVHFGLVGYQKEASLLVSAKTMDMNLVSDNIPQLVSWYTFEGNLSDSRLEGSLKPSANIKPEWIPSDGTYGLAAGYNRSYTFPALAIEDEFSANSNWQTLFRFKPVIDGEIFSIQFSSDVSINVSAEGQNLVLTLSSPLKNISQTHKLRSQDSFITAGISFSVLSQGILGARINISGDEQNELVSELLRLDANIENSFQIVLGQKQDEETPVRDRPVFTAIWDEFAVFKSPPIEIILADVRKAAALSGLQQNYISSN